MILLAVAGHAALIRRLTEDYFRGVLGLSEESWRADPLSRIRARIRHRNVAAAVDQTNRLYCELLLHEDERKVEIAQLLPRGTPLPSLVPVVAVALREMKRRYPHIDPYLISGFFDRGEDERGLPDKGQGLGEAYRAFALAQLGRDVVTVTERPDRNGMFETTVSVADSLAVLDVMGV